MEQPSAKPNRRWPRRRPKRREQQPPTSGAQPEQPPPSHLIVTARPRPERGQAPERSQAPDRGKAPRQPAPAHPNGLPKPPNVAPKPASGGQKPPAKAPEGRRGGRREPTRSEAPGHAAGGQPGIAEASRQAPEQTGVMFKLGTRVRLCDALRQRGGHGRIGVITWVGNLVDVRWEDGTTSFMLVPGLLEAVAE